MTAAGKRDEFTTSDLLAIGKQFGVRHPGDVLDEVVAAVSRWQEYATAAEVATKYRTQVAATHRTL